MTILSGYETDANGVGVKDILLNSRIKSSEMFFALDAGVVRFVAALGELLGIKWQIGTNAPTEAAFLSDFPDATKVVSIT